MKCWKNADRLIPAAFAKAATFTSLRRSDLILKSAWDILCIFDPERANCRIATFQATDPNAMPLNDFISEVMQILEDNPQVEEVLVKRTLAHRFAVEAGREKYDAFFKQYNERLFNDLGRRRELK